MLRLVLRRIALGLLTLWLVSVLVFAATQVLPGNSATAILGKRATPDRVAALERQMHLDKPVPAQYGDWLSGIVHGDAGTSLASQEPVTKLLGDRVVNSAFLVLVAALVTIPLAIGLGVWAAIRRDRLADHLISGTTLVLAAVPEFVIGILLVVLLATAVVHLFPAVSMLPPGVRPWDQPSSVVLVAATLVLAGTPYIARIMRASMIEVLESDYVEMARLKGLPERTVLIRHALPNAIGPVFQVIAINLAYLAGGVVVIESVFNYPGIGLGLVDAVTNHDIPVVQALAMLIAAVYVVLNLLADVATILVTPRLRTRL